MVRGIHSSPVKAERIRKSIGAERTFSKNLASEIYIEDRLVELAKEISRRLTKSKVAGKTITLKIKYSDFSTQTRSKTLNFYISDIDLILDEAKKLLYQEKLQNSVRLLGLSFSNLNNEQKEKIIDRKIDVQLEFKF